MQLHSKCNAIASRLKVTLVTTRGNPHIAHFAHYKKRSQERHETKNKRSANLLAKQMKNTQTSHDIKKGYFIFVGGRKWKPIKKENKPQKPGLRCFLLGICSVTK